MKATGMLENLGEDGVVLFLGAHSDDIEIGCCGTVTRLLEKDNNLTVYWVVLSANGTRAEEARLSAESLLASCDDTFLDIQNFRNGFFPYVAIEIKEYFESLKKLRKPDVVFTHYRNDRHQDHRLVSELTWNTFRDHLILEYEIPKYDGDMGSPNVFVTLTDNQIKTKQDHLMSEFQSQQDKQWFTRETFSSIGRLRGLECNSPTGYAEAFYGRKVIL